MAVLGTARRTGLIQTLVYTMNKAARSFIVLFPLVFFPLPLRATQAVGELSPGAVGNPGPIEMDTGDQWLDAVRAQRQAWEGRRRATRDAFDARRRQHDPWGAFQLESREQQYQQRREAFLDRIEQDREHFRNQGPWQTPAVPEPPDADALPDINPVDAPILYPPLPGWDNRWYYRGY